jgi:hypothetical protein
MTVIGGRITRLHYARSPHSNTLIAFVSNTWKGAEERTGGLPLRYKRLISGGNTP